MQLVRENLRAYLFLNLAAYGLFLVGFVLGQLFPDLVAAREVALQDDGTAELVSGLLANPLLFALVIFGVNLFRMSALVIVLPSLVIPFAGLALFGYWAVQTGITLSPLSAESWVGLIPHSLTLIIELQAYVLFALGAFLLGRAWLRPRLVGVTRRRDGYLQGLKAVGLLALPAVALLIVGALWEALSLRFLLYPLIQMLL